METIGLNCKTFLNLKIHDTMKDVAFLLPAYNEEISIGKLITEIKELYPNSNIIVIDNNSNDKTAEIARNLGAEVIFEKAQGKARAIRTGFMHSDSEYVIMLDADNTYDPKDAINLLKPLKRGEADLVLGSRLKGKKEKGSISKTNILGNYILSSIASLLYHPTSDVCTGYWVFSKEVVDYIIDVGIDCSGFEVEAEMFAKVSKSDFKIVELPIYYRNRLDETKLSSIKDGWKIFKTLWIYRFGSLAMFLVLSGVFSEFIVQ
ncbi:MAG: glycosyltransferase family 2 protein [Methanobacteriaceae archaeon]|nr:glycosyltransferase family 2 protein [Methanobacteriaceae archaeon]